MLPFETRPVISRGRAAPLALERWCWPALGVAAAIVLDALRPLAFASGGRGPSWLDLAALACVAWAVLGPGRARRGDWATPLDRRILAGFAIAVLHVVHVGGADGPVTWLRQIAAAGTCLYALAARSRRDPLSPDALWPAFALVVLALATYALGCATQGWAALESAARLVDVHWASRFGLAKTLLLATLLCVGRAGEPGTRAAWRVTALVGVLASVLAWSAGGAGLGLAPLASLDEPFYFGTSIVAFMLLASLARMAWELARERPDEAGRWRGAAALFPALAVLLLFGGTTGGEGARALAGLAGAAVIAAREAPKQGAARAAAPRIAEPPARAA